MLPLYLVKNRLRVFEMSCLRRIAGVTPRDKIRNKEVCDRNRRLEIKIYVE